MKHSILAPHVGESIAEVVISRWVKENGQRVVDADIICEIESDKATVEIIAEHTGVLQILKPAGEKVEVGTVIAEIVLLDKEQPALQNVQPIAQPVPISEPKIGPAARKLAEELNIDTKSVLGSGKNGTITKSDLMASPIQKSSIVMQQPTPTEGLIQKRVPMTTLRKKIAERLVYAQQTAAILTTFNEVDLKKIIDIRSSRKDSFKAQYGVSLSFMSFFTRATVEALKKIPILNAFIDQTDIIYNQNIDIGIAVGTERGLVVPILRNVETMSFVEIEKNITQLAQKARDKKLSVQEMSGGTFTISNGGTYGSLLSTPILNPPQSGILGMHKIQERAMVLDGKIEVRPMMYLALSYDHRLIDGKEAVSFLVNIKESLENPNTLNLDF